MVLCGGPVPLRSCCAGRGLSQEVSMGQEEIMLEEVIVLEVVLSQYQHFGSTYQYQ